MSVQAIVKEFEEMMKPLPEKQSIRANRTTASVKDARHFTAVRLLELDKQKQDLEYTSNELRRRDQSQRQGGLDLQKKLAEVESLKVLLGQQIEEQKLLIEASQKEMEQQRNATRLYQEAASHQCQDIQKMLELYGKGYGMQFRTATGTGLDVIEVVFTCIDPEDPSREYSASIAAPTANAGYEVVASAPAIPDVASLVADFNKRSSSSKDFGSFVKFVRSIFRKTAGVEEVGLAGSPARAGIKKLGTPSKIPLPQGLASGSLSNSSSPAASPAHGATPGSAGSSGKKSGGKLQRSNSRLEDLRANQQQNVPSSIPSPSHAASPVGRAGAANKAQPRRPA